MVGKRGYFFVVDAIIAGTILLVGLFYLFGVAISAPDQGQSFNTAEDFATILMYQPLYTSTNQYYVGTLLPAGLVENPDATPMEEIAYLAFSDGPSCPTCLSNASAFAMSLMNESLDSTVGAAIYINGTLIYARPIAATAVLHSRGVIVYARMQSNVIAGPVIGEVQLWY